MRESVCVHVFVCVCVFVCARVCVLIPLVRSYENERMDYEHDKLCKYCYGSSRFNSFNYCSQSIQSWGRVGRKEEEEPSSVVVKSSSTTRARICTQSFLPILDTLCTAPPRALLPGRAADGDGMRDVLQYFCCDLLVSSSKIASATQVERSPTHVHHHATSLAHDYGTSTDIPSVRTALVVARGKPTGHGNEGQTSTAIHAQTTNTLVHDRTHRILRVLDKHNVTPVPNVGG